MSADLALHELPAERRAAVAMDAAIARRQQWEREHRRPPALRSGEALAALHFEALVLWASWMNALEGVHLTAEDHARVTTAMARIEAIVSEASA